MSARPRTALGFDFGLKRIGVAVGQELTGTATALETLRVGSGGIDWSAIARLIDEWRPQALIVGLPLNMDGSEHAMTVAARGFGQRLQGRFPAPVYYVDERLSSIEAAETLRREGEGRRLGRDDVLDGIAAMHILETWLREQANEDARDGD